jgi:hypothetical protein
MPRKTLLFGMSDMLANRVSELVGGLLGLIPTKYQLSNISSSVGSKQGNWNNAIMLLWDKKGE